MCPRILNKSIMEAIILQGACSGPDTAQILFLSSNPHDPMREVGPWP